MVSNHVDVDDPAALTAKELHLLGQYQLGKA